MSAFNVIRSRQICYSCGMLAEFVIQFKYGEVWQYEYQIGDQIKWGKNNYGKIGYKRVVVDAVAEKCPFCKADGADYLVWIENDKIVSVQPASGEYDFAAYQQNYIVVNQ